MPIFSVGFVILDFGLWTSELWGAYELWTVRNTPIASFSGTTVVPPTFSLAGRSLSISTPRNSRNVHHLHHSISTEFPQAKFEDLDIRYAMEQMKNSATAALHERDELQKRLKINVGKQKKAKAMAQAK